MQRKITQINWLTWVRTWAAMDGKNMTFVVFNFRPLIVCGESLSTKLGLTEFNDELHERNLDPTGKRLEYHRKQW